MAAGLATYDVEAFYYLARVSMVKDERHLDRFDRAFAEAFKGLEQIGVDDVLNAVDLPADWLSKQAEKLLTEEEKAKIEALGGFEKLMETLKQRLAEQKGRHQGGSKWIGNRRHLSLRRLWLQPRGCAHRAGRKPPQARGEGLGQARVPQPRRRGRAGHAQHQGRAEAAAALGPAGRRGRA